jgi:hypothetical protein
MVNTSDSMLLHLDGAQRAQVGLEDILKTLASADVHLERLTPPLLVNA